MVEEPAEAEAALLALGLARRHLQEVLLDGRVLPLGAFRPLPGCARVAGADAAPDAPRFVALDGSAFDNLEVDCFFLKYMCFSTRLVCSMTVLLRPFVHCCCSLCAQFCSRMQYCPSSRTPL